MKAIRTSLLRWSTMLVLVCVLSLQTVSAKEVSKNFEDFRAAMNSGDIAKAQDVLKTWEEKTPTDPEMDLGWAFFHWLLTKAQVTETDDMSALSTTAMLPDTIAMFQNLERKNHYIMQDAGSGMENFNLMIGRMEKILANNPDLAEAYNNFMEFLNDKKEFKYSTKVALSMIDRAQQNKGKWVNYMLKKAKTDPMSTYMDSQLKTLSENREEELCLILADRLIECYPKEIRYQVYKANAYANSHRPDEAKELYEALYAKHPSEFFLITSMVNFYTYYNNTTRLLQIAQDMKKNKTGNYAIMGAELEKRFSDTVEVNGKKVNRSRMQKFTEMLKSHSDSLSLANYLNEWEKDEPENPEIMVGWIVMYTQLGVYEIEGNDAAKQAQKMLGNLGTVTVRTYQNGAQMSDTLFIHATEWSEKAIAQHPDRLDLYIYQAQAYRYLYNDEQIYETAVAALRQSKVPGNVWKKMYAAPVDVPNDQLMDDYISDRLEELFSIGSFGYVEKLGKEYEAQYPSGQAYKQIQKELKKYGF